MKKRLPFSIGATATNRMASATQSQKLLDRHGYSGPHEEMDGFRERTRKSRDAREKLAGSLSGKTRQLITGALPGSLQSMKFHGNGEFQRHVNPAVKRLRKSQRPRRYDMGEELINGLFSGIARDLVLMCGDASV